jgi:hypothetical protein
LASRLQRIRVKVEKDGFAELGKRLIEVGQNPLASRLHKIEKLKEVGLAIEKGNTS